MKRSLADLQAAQAENFRLQEELFIEVEKYYLSGKQYSLEFFKLQREWIAAMKKSAQGTQDLINHHQQVYVEPALKDANHHIRTQHAGSDR